MKINAREKSYIPHSTWKSHNFLYTLEFYPICNTEYRNNLNDCHVLASFMLLFLFMYKKLEKSI